MGELKKFTDLVDKLIRVPHAEIKKQLVAEKGAKKRKRAKKSSASREAV